MRSRAPLRRAVVVLALLLPLTITRPPTAAAAPPPWPLDMTFGTSGFLPGVEVRALLPDGRLIAFAGGPLIRLLADGTTDPTFAAAVQGTVAVDPSDPTRLVVLSGTTVTRLLASGAVDPSFTPYVWADFPFASRVAVDAVGRVVVAGFRLAPAPAIVRVRRLRADGSPDPTFGGGAPVESPAYTDTTNDLSGLAIGPDGTIAAMTSERPGSRAEEEFDARLLVWTSDGRPDTRYTVPPWSGVTTGLARLAFGTDGSLTVASQTLAKQATVVRYRPDGQRDATFGVGGRVVLDQDQITVEEIVPAADGTTVIVGATPPFGTFSELAAETNSLVIARLSRDGSLDTTFASCGLMRPLRRGAAVLSPVLLQPDGRVLVTMRKYESEAGPTGGVPIVTARFVPDTDRSPAACGARYVPRGGGTRLLDTRGFGGSVAGKLPAGGQIDVPVLGRPDSSLTTGVSAVVLNITGTEADAAGFVTAWPTGTPRPTASVLNLAGPGDTAADLVTVAVGQGGKVSLYSQSGAHLVVDLFGYYEPTGGFAFSGHIVPIAPTRALDTRDDGAPVGPDAAISVRVAGVGTVPGGTDTPLAIIANLTATNVDADGYVAADLTPSFSNLNVSAGQTRANQIMIALPERPAPLPDIPLLSQPRADLLLDIQGYVARRGGSSEFVAVGPTRVLDTRLPAAPSDRLLGGETIVTTVVDPSDYAPYVVEGIVATVTAVDATGPGFVSVWPEGPRPLVSNLNLDAPGQTRPNQVIVPVDGQGRIRIYSHSAADIVVDVSGVIVDRPAPMASPN